MSGTGLLRAFEKPAPRVGDQPSGIDDGLPGGRQGFDRICLAGRAVDDFPLRDIELVSHAPLTPGAAITRRPRLTAFCRKIRANPSATMTRRWPTRVETACSREEPQPKFFPASRMLPGPPAGL